MCFRLKIKTYKRNKFEVFSSQEKLQTSIDRTWSVDFVKSSKGKDDVIFSSSYCLFETNAWLCLCLNSKFQYGPLLLKNRNNINH